MTLFMKKVCLLLCLILSVIAIAVFYFAPIFPMRTVYYIQLRYHDQELRYMDAPKSKEEVFAMSRILEDYGERYVVLNGRILIPLKLYFDMDLLRNYTSKAGLSCPDRRFVLDGHIGCDLWIEADPKTAQESSQP